MLQLAAVALQVFAHWRKCMSRLFGQLLHDETAASGWVVKGSIRLALAPLSRQITLR
jgi:hypothetical protein